MSRLSAQADMEYLPSYGPTIAGLAQLFDNIGQLRDLAPLRLIDPCAGEGDALRTLADALRTEYESTTGRRIAKKQIETYGVELDTERARKARRKLKRVVQTDYFNTLVTPEAFNLMLLNPPYDYDADYKRLEQRFLVRATQLLTAGGILIYMVPRYVLNTSAKFLARNYSKLPRLAGGRQPRRRALQPGDADGGPQYQPAEPDREPAEPGALRPGQGGRHRRGRQVQPHSGRE